MMLLKSSTAVRRSSLGGLLLLATSLFTPLEAAATTYLVTDYAACDGSTDDTLAIQGLLDSVKAGSQIFFPGMTVSYCRTTAPLRVSQPLHLKGGSSPMPTVRRTDTHPLGPTVAGEGAVLWISSSDVLVENLRLTGNAYGPSTIRNTDGVYVHAPVTGDRLHNITLRNLTVSKQRGRGIFLVDVDDFIIEDSHVEDIGYAGIFGVGVRRGWIRGNHVEDIGDPETCEGLATLCNDYKPGTEPPECGFIDTPCRNHSTYGIVVTGCGPNECSEDVLISSNTVREVETWVGIMNHGGQRVLIFDNDVVDANFLYANTIFYGPPNFASSDDTAFINNTGDILPRIHGGRYDVYANNPKGEGIWFYSATNHPAANVMAIGNVFRNTGHANFDAAIVAWPHTGGRFTYNKILSGHHYSDPETGVVLTNRGEPSGITDDVVVAHNSIRASAVGVLSEAPNPGTHVVSHNEIYATQFGLHIATGGEWDISQNYAPNSSVDVEGTFLPWTAPSATPSTPHHVLAVAEGNGEILLQWAHDGSPHDSFTIEFRSTAFFNHLAYRPAAVDMWRFDAPTNPHWTPFSPNTYRVTGLVPGVRYSFRLRANDGAESSTWSYVFSAVAN